MGVERSPLKRLPPGCTKSKETMLVIGTKGKPFKMPVIKDVEIDSENKICLGDMLLVEKADYNLLGKDLIVALGINLIVKESQLVVSLYKLTTEDEGKIDSKMWYAPGEAGRLEIEPIHIEVERPEEPIRIKHYPISMEGRRGLKPVIDDLVKGGTLEPCMSRHNTPILVVRKTDGSYRQWIEEYSEKVKFLYEKLTTDRLKWTEQDEDGFKELKATLIAAPVLSLPDVKRQFQLFVDVSNHTAHGVLTQDWAGARKPVGYVSKLLDPVSRGWPTCLQDVAVALLVEETKKITFGAPLVVYTPYNVRGILQQKADNWLTDARLLKYEAILIHSQELELRTTSAQNPAQFLFGEALEGITDNCAEVVELQTKIRPDLEEEELEERDKWFVDGSAKVVEGKRKSKYAIVDGKTGEVVESGPLSASWSAQACELYTVLRVLKRLKGKKRTIFIDSKYAFAVVHTFGKIWEDRDLVSTCGRGLVHGEIIKQILEAIREPEAISIVHVRGDTFYLKGHQTIGRCSRNSVEISYCVAPPELGTGGENESDFEVTAVKIDVGDQNVLGEMPPLSTPEYKNYASL
ncbi:hypothetical protein HGM15179_018629 [Zosterops borbonicus]|uniref:RNase H type-1 domain-containing protein n=1 Tax=Zosterops borbonicus TaxID=364589 RepID=A0A8K1FYT9_9PASS|nr:hypothetical protein HGM15179_018629 [Zosterops borbonicus]